MYLLVMIVNEKTALKILKFIQRIWQKQIVLYPDIRDLLNETLPSSKKRSG